MNARRCSVEQYIDFLLASPKVVSTTEAARVQPPHPHAPAHDSFTRLLNDLEPEPEVLWQEVRPFVRTRQGLLVLDHPPLDNPSPPPLGLVGHFWPGKHRRVVRGINLLTLVWTDGDALWPCDYRLVNPADGKTK